MNIYEEKLKQFVEDTVLYQAVREILEAEFDLNVVVKEETPSSELVEMVKSRIDGRKLLSNGFKKIDSFKQQQTVEKSKVNPAV